MTRSDVNVLYFIAPIKNLLSICSHGILSFNNAQKISPESVADPKIQERRVNVVVPGIHKSLHDYANLYFNPRNAMMFKRKNIHQELCIVGVSTKILDGKDVLITDGNASSNYRRFYDSPWGLAQLDAEYVFRRDWRHGDTFEYWRRKSCVCSEVLVPDRVPVDFIDEIYVSCTQTKDKVTALLNQHSIRILVTEKPDFFFQ